MLFSSCRLQVPSWQGSNSSLRINFLSEFLACSGYHTPWHNTLCPFCLHDFLTQLLPSSSTSTPGAILLQTSETERSNKTSSTASAWSKCTVSDVIILITGFLDFSVIWVRHLNPCSNKLSSDADRIFTVFCNLVPKSWTEEILLPSCGDGTSGTCLICRQLSKKELINKF
jgi:hypothetical protein